jgi:hypothetical protein
MNSLRRRISAYSDLQEKSLFKFTSEKVLIHNFISFTVEFITIETLIY